MDGIPIEFYKVRIQHQNRAEYRQIQEFPLIESRPVCW